MTKMKKLAASLALVGGISSASAAVITTPAGVLNFGGFDWSSNGSILVTGYDVLANSSFSAGYSDTFSLYYQAYATSVLDSSGNVQAATGLRTGSGSGYEYTITAQLTERVTCLTNGCTIVQIDVIGGNWSINYDATGNASAAAGTGFADGVTILSGIFTGGDSIVGAQGASNPGNVTLSGTFRGLVQYIDAAYITGDLTDTQAVSTLQFGRNTTAWTRPANFEGYGPTPTDSNSTYAGQADANQSFSVPEPGSLALVGLGLGFASLLRRRQRS
jgi:hypothetical protein